MMEGRAGIIISATTRKGATLKHLCIVSFSKVMFFIIGHAFLGSSDRTYAGSHDFLLSLGFIIER